MQLSVAVRNAVLDSIESTVGTAPRLKIRSGSVPSSCASADSGTVLADISCPSDWQANASSGSKAKSGTWEDTSADATGTAGHFRLYDSSGSTCHVQGTITVTGSGGDMTLDNVSITSGQTITITSFTFTAGNA